MDIFRKIRIIFGLGFFVLAGCSGGGGGDGGIDGSGLEGTAAVGAPLSGAEVIVKDRNGNSKTETVRGDGYYKFDNIDDLEPPLIIRVRENITNKTYFSVRPSIERGKVNRANVHPISDVAAKNWFRHRGRNIENVFDVSEPFDTLPDDSGFNALKNALKALLRLAYEDFGVDEDFDFITSSFNADESGTGFDGLLDNATVVINENHITIEIKDPETGFRAKIIIQFDLDEDLAQIDNQSPDQVAGLQVVPASSTKMLVVWDPATDNIGIAGYDVHWGHDTNTSEGVISVPYPVLQHGGSAPDEALIPGQQYCYKVEAVDGAGNRSTITDAVCNDTPNDDNNPVPGIPAGLTALDSENSSINLSWTAPTSGDVIGYFIYRSENVEANVHLANDQHIATSLVTSFEDIGVEVGADYCYSVTAVNSDLRESAPSNIGCTSPTSGPGAPPVSSADLPGGIYNSAQTVSLSCVIENTGGCTIHYTTDSTAPTLASAVYSTPLNITETTTLRFFAADNDYPVNTELSANQVIYTIDAVAPNTTASPAGNTYGSAQEVTLTCNDGVDGAGCQTIYYSTDGSNPTLEYTAPINISVDTTLRFYSVDNAGNAETPTNEEVYVIDNGPNPPANPPVVSGDTFTNDVTPTWTWTTGGGGNGTFRYRLDNADLSVGATQTTATAFTPGSPLSLGIHTLHVQEQNSLGQWSASGTYTITIEVVLPSTGVSPVGGLYNAVQNVTLTCTDVGGSGCATIYYTTDGSTPNTGSAQYSTPINISTNTELNFFAVDNAGNSEPVQTEIYEIDTVDPTTTASPAGGTYTTSQDVVLSCDDGAGSGCAVIYYTTDGSEPTTGSTVYTTPVNVSTDTTLRFFAVDNAGNQESPLSSENEQVYTFVAPLVVDVSVLSNPVEAGGKVFYAITVNNVSFTTVDNVNVALQIPTGFSFNGNPDAQPNVLCGGNFTCAAGEQAVWNFTSIPAGGSETIHINADADAGLNTGDSIATAFSVTATGISGSIDINKTVDVNNSPSAQLALSADRDPVMPGETYRLLVDFGNTSGGVLTGTELRAFLPAGVTVVDTDGGIDAGGGEIVWDLSASPIGVGAALQRVITVTAPALPGAISSDIHKASAQLTFDGGTAVDIIAEHAVSVLDASTVPLLFDVSVTRSPAITDSKLHYTFTVSNDSFQPLNNVAVLYRIPEGVSFDGNPDAQPNVLCGGNFTCQTNEEAAWDVGTIPAGGSVSINLNADVALGTLNGTLLSAPIRVVADELDDTMSLLHTVAVDNTEDAQLSLSTDRDPVMPGETYRLLVDFGNTSGGVLTGTELRAILPAGVTVVDTDGGIDAGGGEIVWDLSVTPIGVGAALHREVVVTAPALPGSMSTDIHKASARLTFDGGAEVDVIAEHAVTVLNANTVPLLFDVSVARSPAVADNKLHYTFTVSNDSFQPLNNVTVLYRIPAGVSFNGSTDAQPDVLCGGNFPCLADEEAAWNVGTIPAGGSVSINLNADVALGTLNGTLLSAPIRVVADELADTMNLVHTVPVDNTEDAQLSLSADRDPVMPGETYTLLLDFGNTSGGVLTGTELRAFLPAGVTVVDADGGTDTGTGEVFWTLGNVLVGEALHREIIITAPDLPVTVSTDIHKTSAQLTFDGGAEVDVIAEHAVTVMDASTVPLLFDVSVARSPAVAGNKLYYTFTVSNDSFQPLNNVTVLYRIPEGVSFDGNPDAQPNVLCGGNFTCQTNEEAAWDVGAIPAGGSVSINLNADVALGTLNGTLLSAPIRVVADELDDTMSLVHTVPVDNTEDAQLSLSADRDPVMPGETYTLLLDIGNISGGQLTGSELRLFLPVGSTVVSAGGGTDTGSGEIFWNLGNIAIGDSQHFEVSITAPTLPVIVSTDIHKASAQLTFDGGAEVDVVAEHAVTVLDGTPELTVSVSATPVPVATGGVLSYTITVSNTSAVAINNVSLVYRVPANVSFSGNTDAVPNVLCGGNFTCQAGEEAVWTFASIAAGASEVITVNASVAGGLLDGTLITAPVIGTVDEMSDTISISYSVPIQ